MKVLKFFMNHWIIPETVWHPKEKVQICEKPRYFDEECLAA